MPLLRVFLTGITDEILNEECMIDTGFTGFAKVSLSKAHRLGLPIAGMPTFVLANGESQKWPSAYGVVTLDKVPKPGEFVVNEIETISILGMQFLSAFGMVLIVHPERNLIALLDQELWGSFRISLPAEAGAGD